MGTIFNCKCDNCEYVIQIIYGRCLWNHKSNYDDFFGINSDSKKPFFYELIKDSEIINKVEYIIQNEKNIKLADAKCNSSFCSKCHNMYDVYQFHITFDNGEYIPQYFCLKCKNTPLLPILDFEEKSFVILKDGQKINWRCPECKEKGFSSNIDAYSYIFFD